MDEHVSNFLSFNNSDYNSCDDIDFIIFEHENPYKFNLQKFSPQNSSIKKLRLDEQKSSIMQKIPEIIYFTSCSENEAERYDLLYCYNTKTHEKHKVPICTFIQMSQLIGIENRFFLIGSLYEKNPIQKHAILKEFIEEKCTLIMKEHMRIARNNFGLSRLPKNTFCVIGGEGTYGIISTECEKYDITNNTWNFLPSLKIAQASCACILFEERKLYCASIITECIQILDLLDLENGWQIFEPRCINSYQFTENAIMLPISQSEVLALNTYRYFHGSKAVLKYNFLSNNATIDSYYDTYAEKFTGIPYIYQHKIYFCGHKLLRSYNILNHKFFSYNSS